MERKSPYPTQTLEINLDSLERVDMLAPVSYRGEGFIKLGNFPRILEEAPSHESDDGFYCAIQSWHTNDQPRMHVSIQGRMPVYCQRCLEPFPFELKVEKIYVFLETESEADEFPLDRDDEEAMVASTHFNLFEAIEDEILLALPHAPKHPPGECQFRQTGLDSEKPNPFKILKNLKK